MKGLLLCSLLLASCTLLSAAERVALVIGNNRYANLPDSRQLASPVADATDVAAALKALGYTLVTGGAVTDAGRDAIITATESFAEQAQDAEAAVFFYSGHGVQVGEDNFLLPSDAPKLTGISVLKNRAVLLRDTIMVALEEAGAKTKVIILDCCRDNPFSAQLDAALSSIGKGTKTKAVGEITGYGPGFYLAFATSPGTSADDGNGKRNSPFTASLLKTLPGGAAKDIDIFFREVKSSLGRDQVSWTNNSLTGGFALAPGVVPVIPTLTAPHGAMTPSLGTASLHVESTPAGLPFTVLPYTTEIEKLHADLNEKRAEWRQYTTEYAIKGLPAERNKFLKARIGELDGEVKRLEGQLGATPPPFARTGTTPAVLDGLNPGTYRVVVRCEGWPDQKLLTSLNPGAAGAAKAQFIGGSLKVDSEPSGASVTMNGKVLGKTPLTLQSLPPGARTLRVSKEGYSTKTLETTFEPGGTTVLSASLNKELNFDGTWRGSVSRTASDGSSATTSDTYVIRGNKVQVVFQGEDGKLFYNAQRTGRVMSFFGTALDGNWQSNWQVTLSADGTSLSVYRSFRFVSGVLAGVTGTDTGTLHRAK